MLQLVLVEEAVSSPRGRQCCAFSQSLFGVNEICCLLFFRTATKHPNSRGSPSSEHPLELPRHWLRKIDSMRCSHNPSIALCNRKQSRSETYMYLDQIMVGDSLRAYQCAGGPPILSLRYGGWLRGSVPSTLTNPNCDASSVVSTTLPVIAIPSASPCNRPSHLSDTLPGKL